MLKQTLFACSFTVLVACTAPPGSAPADIVAQADPVVLAFASGAEVQSELIENTATYRRLCRYLGGAQVDLTAPVITASPSKPAQAMARFATSLGSYTEALGAAADGGSIAKLQATAKGFAAQVGTDAAAPLARLGIRVGGARRDATIRAIMEDALVALVVIEDDVLRDAPQVVSETRTLMEGWDSAVNCVLREMRRTPADAEVWLDRATAERAALENRVTLVAATPGLLDTLMTAHVFATAEEPDIDAALASVKAGVADIKAIAAAIGDN